jgi:hypothetical protein
VRSNELTQAFQELRADHALLLRRVEVIEAHLDGTGLAGTQEQDGLVRQNQYLTDNIAALEEVLEDEFGSGDRLNVEKVTDWAIRVIRDLNSKREERRTSDIIAELVEERDEKAALAKRLRAALQEAELGNREGLGHWNKKYVEEHQECERLRDLVVTRDALITKQRERIEHLQQMDSGYRFQGEVQLEHSDAVLYDVHDPLACKGRPCPIHGRTDHPLRYATQVWRSDRGVVERICEHGVGHPDPDSLPGTKHMRGCDGCCGMTEERTA